jgi:dihydrofolate reductase
MALIATLVVGANQATTLDGKSAPLSTPPDRARFLALHRNAGAIITGKESAAVEDYSKTEVPILIFTRNSERLHFDHPLMQQVTVDRNLSEISRVLDSRIKGDVVIEAGPRLLMALISVGAVDKLFLSISEIAGDGNFIDTQALLADFLIEGDETIEGTRLLECRYNSNSANS